MGGGKSINLQFSRKLTRIFPWHAAYLILKQAAAKITTVSENYSFNLPHSLLPDVITRVHPLKTSFNGILPALAATFK